MKEDKKIVEYYLGERMLFRLGKVNYTKAHRPLKVHTHMDMTEFVFLIKGCQIYSVEERSYRLTAVIFLLPGLENGIVPEGIPKINHHYII